jgi:hypothetical protein
MNDPNNNRLPPDEWSKSVKSALDEGVSALDEEVCKRLQQARREAVLVAMDRQANHSRVTRWLVPAGGFAVLTLAAVLSFLIGIGPGDKLFPVDQSSMASSDDLPLLTSPESLELYEELDFYQWLEEEQERVG